MSAGEGQPVKGARTLRRALLSVTDKTGIVEFGRGLAERDFELLSTGGTAKALREAGLDVTDVSEVTGFPEMMDGRLKTLHPKVHGGLLSLRDDPGHVAAMEAHGIAPIDVVAVNLYRFEQTVARPGVTVEDAMENVDIGGPSMLRSAAKNHRSVWVVVDPADYAAVLGWMDDERGGGDAALLLERRRALATKAYETTAAYDTAIGAWFRKQLSAEASAAVPAAGAHDAGAGGSAAGGDAGADLLTALRGALAAPVTEQPLRYGENPNQPAVFAARTAAPAVSLAGAEQLSGKALSYNNILDADAALQLVAEFDGPAVAVIKHSNPCGCGIGDTLALAFERAWSGDPQSAFGGIVALNRPVDRALAERIATPDHFLEVILAPSFEEGAVEVLQTGAKWGRNVRLLAVGPLDGPRDTTPLVRSVAGGWLVQQPDVGFDHETREVVTRRRPAFPERADLEFAWRVCKHVKSNAIVLAKNGAIVGVGAGQMSRVDAVFMALHKAGERANGTVLASDAFFPFRDSIDEAAAEGVIAVIQPGGSIRDKESIAAADEHQLAMVFTGARHFRH